MIGTQVVAGVIEWADSDTEPAVCVALTHQGAQRAVLLRLREIEERELIGWFGEHIAELIQTIDPDDLGDVEMVLGEAHDNGAIFISYSECEVLP